MLAAQNFRKLSRQFRHLRQHAAAMLMICLFCSVGGRHLSAAGGFEDVDTFKAAIAEAHQTPEDFFRSREQMRDVVLNHTRAVLADFAKKKKATENDGELFIQSLELVSYIIDPRAEDLLLSDQAFASGWIVLRGVARQDPTTVVPKLIALFDHGYRTRSSHSVRQDVGYVYGTMFENGRLSAESPHYVKIRSQILTLRASSNDDERYVAVFALRRLPRDAEATAALERLAKDPSHDKSIRSNAVKALAARAERFKSGATPPAQ